MQLDVAMPCDRSQQNTQPYHNISYDSDSVYVTSTCLNDLLSLSLVWLV